MCQSLGGSCGVMSVCVLLVWIICVDCRSMYMYIVLDG